MNVGQLISDFFEGIFYTVLSLVDYIFPLDFILDGHVNELVNATYETLNMLVVSGVFSLLFGLILGVIITVTQTGGILSNRYIAFISDKFINFFRSIPFVILIPVLMVLTRAIMGTTIGLPGTYIPLILGTIPFFARQIESALSEVDYGLIEASIAMGSSPMEIIFRVYLKESIPSIVRGTTITFISLLGLTAMAGQVGGGGLGSFAIRYGYQRNYTDATWVTVGIILIIVTLIQAIGSYIIKRTIH